MRSIYLNGDIVDEKDAKVSVFDRGLQFADSVYEVVGVMDGLLVDFDSHMQRLARSLGELDIPQPVTREEILGVCRDLVARNAIADGLVYLQITRGTAERDFVYAPGLKPTIIMFTQTKPASENRVVRDGVALKSVPDQRWARRDIKTTGLLAQVLAKQIAADAGCYEALLTRDRMVTEGGATSAYIVTAGTIVTHPLTNDILSGRTRKSVLELARLENLAVDERAFSLEEAYAADEAFITGASTYVCPVIRIDDHVIGDGVPGPYVRHLQEIYVNAIRANLI